MPQQAPLSPSPASIIESVIEDFENILESTNNVTVGAETTMSSTESASTILGLALRTTLLPDASPMHPPSSPMTQQSPISTSKIAVASSRANTATVQPYAFTPSMSDATKASTSFATDTTEVSAAAADNESEETSAAVASIIDNSSSMAPLGEEDAVSYDTDMLLLRPLIARGSLDGDVAIDEFEAVSIPSVPPLLENPNSPMATVAAVTAAAAATVDIAFIDRGYDIDQTRANRTVHGIKQSLKLESIVPTEARLKFAVARTSSIAERNNVGHYLIMDDPEVMLLKYRADSANCSVRSPTTRNFSTKWAELFRARNLPDFDVTFVRTVKNYMAVQDLALVECTLPTTKLLTVLREELSREYNIYEWAPLPDNFDSVLRRVNAMRSAVFLTVSRRPNGKTEAAVYVARKTCRATVLINEIERTSESAYRLNMSMLNDPYAVPIGHVDVRAPCSAIDTEIADRRRGMTPHFGCVLEFDDIVANGDNTFSVVNPCVLGYRTNVRLRSVGILRSFLQREIVPKKRRSRV